MRALRLGWGVILTGLLCTCAEGSFSGTPKDGSSGSRGFGLIVAYLTDAPGAYDQVWVTIDELRVHRAGGGWTGLTLTTIHGDTNLDGVWDVIPNPDGTVRVDLIALRGVETLLATAQVDAGKYTQLRMGVVEAEAVAGGVAIPLKVPSGGQTGLKLVEPFEVNPDEIVNLLIDFDADESIVERGSSGEPHVLKPVIHVSAGSGDPSSGTVTFLDGTFPIPGSRVIYVLDRSGSMGWTAGTWTDRFGNTVTGSRWDRVADRAIASFQDLPVTARFNVFAFWCSSDSWMGETQFATPENKAAAEAFLLQHSPYGGTGIGPAVVEALQDRETLTYLLFSDGSPNCGAPGIPGHLQMILDANIQGAAIHTFGRCQGMMLDLATLTGGTCNGVPW